MAHLRQILEREAAILRVAEIAETIVAAEGAVMENDNHDAKVRFSSGSSGGSSSDTSSAKQNTLSSLKDEHGRLSDEGEGKVADYVKSLHDFGNAKPDGYWSQHSGRSLDASRQKLAADFHRETGRHVNAADYNNHPGPILPKMESKESLDDIVASVIAERLPFHSPAGQFADGSATGSRLHPSVANNPDAARHVAKAAVNAHARVMAVKATDGGADTKALSGMYRMAGHTKALNGDHAKAKEFYDKADALDGNTLQGDAPAASESLNAVYRQILENNG